MESHLRITARERQALLEQYRKGANTRVRLRAHILLLLAQGYSWAPIAGVLFCSTRTIARWKTRVDREGISEVLRPSGPAAAGLGGGRSGLAAHWRTAPGQRHFGLLRTRCCRAAVSRRL